MDNATMDEKELQALAREMAKGVKTESDQATHGDRLTRLEVPVIYYKGSFAGGGETTP